MGEVLLRDIIERLGGELIGDPALRIGTIEPLESAGPAAIAFLSNQLYAKQLAASRAGCVIVAPGFRDAAEARGAAIVTPCLLYTSPSPRDRQKTRMPSS